MDKNLWLETINTIIDMRSRKTKMPFEGEEWSWEDTDRLRAMYKIGYGLTSIAMLLDRTEDEIIERAKQIGIYCYQKSVEQEE